MKHKGVFEVRGSAFLWVGFTFFRWLLIIMGVSTCCRRMAFNLLVTDLRR